MTSTEAQRHLAAYLPRLFQTSAWPAGEIPAGWVGLVRYTLARIDAALSDEDSAAFQLVGVEESRGRLVIVARYPVHCDPEIDQILVDAWDASSDICELCAAYSAHITACYTLCRDCAHGGTKRLVRAL